MPYPRRRRRGRTSVRGNALKGRPNQTVVRVSQSTQTVVSGTPKQFQITQGGSPTNWFTDLDHEVIVDRIKGYIGYVPNANEKTFAAADFESWAGYPAILRLDKDRAADGTAEYDPFNDPDRGWLWQPIPDKGNFQVAAAGLTGIGMNYLKPTLGHLWKINITPCVKLTQRQDLVCALNYTADGVWSNSSWWFAFYMWIRY